VVDADKDARIRRAVVLVDMATALGMEVDLVQPRMDPDTGGHVVPLGLRRAVGLGPLTPREVADAYRLGPRGERLFAAAAAAAHMLGTDGPRGAALAAVLEEYGLW